jgi:hypothetical protein
VGLVDRPDVAAENEIAIATYASAWIGESNHTGQPFTTKQPEAPAQHPGLTVGGHFIEKHESPKLY